MMGKTHIAVGIAAAYTITQPKTMPEFVFAAKASLDALYGEILAIAISVGSLAGDFFTGGNIIQGILGNTPRLAVGAAMFVALTVIGELSKHRDKTHSLLALVLFSVAVFLIEPHIGIAFAIGYSSHLIIDLLNKSPIRILYPLKKGICFKFCYADRLGNELLLIAGVLIMVLYIFLHSLL